MDSCSNGFEASDYRILLEFDSLEAAKAAFVQAYAWAAGYSDNCGDAIDGGDKKAIANSETALSFALQGIQLGVEDNPEITATGHIETLQKQLEKTEDQIAAARRLYNGNVQNLNQRRFTFPSNFIASRHIISDSLPFEMDTAEKLSACTRPKVNRHR